jgi:hypothetical protein
MSRRGFQIGSRDDPRDNRAASFVSLPFSSMDVSAQERRHPDGAKRRMGRPGARYMTLDTNAPISDNHRHPARGRTITPGHAGERRCSKSYTTLRNTIRVDSASQPV